MSLTSKVATNVSCGGRCLRALPRREFGEPKRRVSHRPSASKHADAFASTQLVGVTFDCFHLAVRLRDHKADMAVSIPRIDEEQMTGLDLIGITSGDLKWNATEPSSTRLLPHVVHAGSTWKRRADAELTRGLVKAEYHE